MKHILVRIKLIASMLVWDLVASLALFFMLSLVLSQQDYKRTVDYLIFMIAIFSVVLVIFLKYQLMYKRYTRDDVTGGKNKREFERIAKDLIKGEGSYVLVYANIDRFKLINEGYGSQTGDKILRNIQKIIDDELRFDEVSGRIMSDNFGILMRYHSIPRLDQRLHRISQQISELEDETGNKYGVVLYFGVYIVEDDDDTDISTMLEHANMARTKISPSHLVPMGIYDDRDRQRLSREKTLEMKMRTALQSGHFVPYLQPKYELKGETIAGAEALVRWVDPEEGMIFPNEFIPLFEKNGFVVDIDLYMFEEVCKMITKWKEDGQEIIPVSVNLSRSHFEIPDFFSYYEQILEKYDIPPKSIEIELTESLFYNELESLNQLVSRIHEAGLSCSIDDFGSGYSSLNMLKDVRVDALKLDRVFFANGDDRRGRDVIQSVIRLAQALNLHTVSEGVEERNQVEFLKEMDCDLIQGYVFAKPMPVPEFENMAFSVNYK